MTCDEIKILLMDFLYNEGEPESEKLVRAHLQNCPACRGEFEALSRTSLTLKAWENEDSRLHLVFVPERRSWLDAMKEKFLPERAPAWGKLAGLAAGIAIGVLFISALLNTEITYDNGNFAYRTSLLPRPSGASADSQLVVQIRRELNERYQQMLFASQQQQRDELNRTLAQFATEVDRQRQIDLLLVDRGFDEFQQHTNSRLEQNNELLNQFLRNVKLPTQK